MTETRRLLLRPFQETDYDQSPNEAFFVPDTLRVTDVTEGFFPFCRDFGTL
jgi:hypothetical protein